MMLTGGWYLRMLSSVIFTDFQAGLGELGWSYLNISLQQRNVKTTTCIILV